ncbi:MAG TPA: ABC transporter substrate-binding protein [Dehalococcoidales bacterium]|nr:ABC transporter substrate-binding protein [Dehalococcoidales bacterium]
MKSRVVWLTVSCLMVAALVLSSCQAAVEGEKEKTETVTGKVTEKAAPTVEEEEAVVEAAVEEGAVMVKNVLGKMVREPQYGGTIRYRLRPSSTEHFDWIWWDANAMCSIIYDRIDTVRWERGPAGTNENPINYTWYTEEWYGNELSESFEAVDLRTCRTTLKQGIRFWDKPPVNGREVVADDVVWSFIRRCTHPQASWYSTEAQSLDYWTKTFDDIASGKIPLAQFEDWLVEIEENWIPVLKEWEPLVKVWRPEENPGLLENWPSVEQLFEEKGYDVSGLPVWSTYVKKIDKYTYEYRRFQAYSIICAPLRDCWFSPHEVVDEYGSLEDWEHVVGTGAWIPTDYVSDSSVNFKRNPNYWQSDPLLPDYKLPYADNLVVLAIIDDSTYYAALRTGKLDTGYVEWDKVDSFKKNCPEMLNRKSVSTTTHVIHIRTDEGPFSDVRVRQAAMLAIDQPSMADEFYAGSANIHAWPVQPVFPSVWEPLSALPQEVQELYQYHPDKARALLTEAGYPDGFKTTFIVYPSQADRDSCLIVAEYLKAVGINAEIEVPEATNYVSMLYGRQYQDMISCWWGNDSIYDVMECCDGGWLGSPYNFSNVLDDYCYNAYTTYMAEPDADERSRIHRDEVRYVLPLVYEIVLPTPVGSGFWWPWLANYHGEADLGKPDETRWGEIPKYLWIDQDLKYEITGKRD